MKCPIHHIDLVCPSCQATARGRKGGLVRSTAKMVATRRNGLQKGADRRTPETAYGLYDCLATFQAHPAEKLSRQNLLALVPASKRANAEKTVRKRLQILLAKRMILRVGRGLYQLGAYGAATCGEAD